MPHIDWKRLARTLREHMYGRIRTREITADDMVKLMNWISANPEVPEGAWCKAFGTFKLAGRGASPGTLLPKDQNCNCTRI